MSSNITKEQIEGMIDKCIDCKICTNNCDFLKKYNLNLKQFYKREDLAYNCFLCGDCVKKCPVDIDGKKISMYMRRNLVQKNNNKLDKNIYKSITIEKNNYLFKNYKRADKKSVLFMGCNFPSYLPETTKKLVEIMSENYGIGAIFDCCGKPVSELGLVQKEDNILKKLQKQIDDRQIEELVMVCPNCYYYLKDKLNVKIINIYEKLNSLNYNKKIYKNKFYCYRPCPDRNSEKWLKDILKFVEYDDLKIINSQCCGLGGLAGFKESKISNELITNLTNSIIDVQSEMVYTYCATCVGNIRKHNGDNVTHIISQLLEVNEEKQKGLKSLQNRFNFTFY